MYACLLLEFCFDWHESDSGGISVGSDLTGLPFDVSGHNAATSYVAKNMLARMDNDVKYYSQELRTLAKSVQPSLKYLDISYLRSALLSPGAIELENSLQLLGSLESKLSELRKHDLDAMNQQRQLAVQLANHVQILDGENALEKWKFLFRRFTGMLLFLLLPALCSRFLCVIISSGLLYLRMALGYNCKITFNYLTAALISTASAADLNALNPFLPQQSFDQILNAAAAALLHCNRIGHTNRKHCFPALALFSL